jgi:carbon-monoxide dehydrogenase medium subunit
VKPPPFAYHDPQTVDEALDLLAESGEDASVLAGGQSLIPLMNMRLSRPDVVIDVNGVGALDEVTVTPDTVTIGATSRLSALERDNRITDALPVITQAASYVAHPQIRNRTTMGGTLCHADPAAEIPSVAVALDAQLNLRSRAGTRTVTADEFFDSVFVTAKNPDELLLSTNFPRRPGMVVRYDEVARRHGDFPFVGLCLGMRLDDGVVAEACAAAAGIAERPQRLHQLERTLNGQPPAAVADEAAYAAAAEVNPSTDQHGTADFRRGLLRTSVRRLIAQFEEVRA